MGGVGRRQFWSTQSVQLRCLTAAFHNYLCLDVLATRSCCVLLLYVHGKQLWSCRYGKLTYPHFSWAGVDLLGG